MDTTSLIKQEIRQLKERVNTLEHDLKVIMEQQQENTSIVEAIRHNDEFMPLVFVANKTGVKHWQIRSAIVDGTLALGSDYIKQKNRYFVRESAIYDHLMEF